MLVHYYEAAGDIVGAYRSWRSCESYKNETSVTFSSQVFDFVKGVGGALNAYSFGDVKNKVCDDDWCLESDHLFGGVNYHLRIILRSLFVMWRAIRHRPNLIIVNSGIVSYFLVPILSLMGAKVVYVFHNSLHPRGVGFFGGFLQRFGLRLFSSYVFKVLVVSDLIRRQLIYYGELPSDKIDVFFPQFSSELFGSKVVGADSFSDIYSFAYIGRVVFDKGILSLLAVALGLRRLGVCNFVIHVCGDGSDMRYMTTKVGELGLSENFLFHGHLSQFDLLSVIRGANCTIVPTSGKFPEGFCMVVAESVMSGVPVICSSVVPALEYFPGAIFAYPVDDDDALLDSVKLLISDSQIYRRLRDVCKTDQRFFDVNFGLSGKLSLIYKDFS